jgi:1,4-dihydroxy-2-naphthoate octaprenyltransferase
MRPLHLLLAALTYTLGASIPAYLGKPLNVLAFWLGFAAILLIQTSMALLAEVFRPHNEPLIEGETPQKKETLRNNLLYISIASLTSAAFLVYMLYVNHILILSSFLFLLSSLILVLVYSAPPLRFLNRGFGELTLAAQVAYIIPSIAFILQYKENHRLLIFILIPLTALALAYFLILDFTTFESDEKYQRATLLCQLTWERAVPLHHSLVAFAYATFAFTYFFGYSVIWAALLTLPFAILQIILLRHIALGGKPNWRLLTVTALAVFGLTTYFITLSFWLR